jgi:glycosyltransferase involved in cell wall biosynthesis
VSADATNASGSERDPGPSAPYVLYVGSLDAHKNLPFLVRSFAAAVVDARLLLVGGRGKRLGDVSATIASSPARARIELRRDVTDAEIESLYRGAEMLVLPSRYEGFGFTALEAMARDCPVLASDIPALREISGDGALLLPPDDERAWTKAIRDVLRDHGLREDLRRRGSETVARYSWDATARAVCELFRRVGNARS